MADILPRREEISRQYQWHIEDLYADDGKWEEEFQKLNAMLPMLEDYRGRLGESPQIFLAMLRRKDEINQLAERVYVYANQRLHEDTGNGTYQELAGRSQTVMIRLSAASAYIVPEILALEEGTVERFLEEEPQLAVYRHFLEEILREKEHVLSPESEELLAQAEEMAQGPSDIFAMFNNADIKFPSIWGEDGEPMEVTHGKYLSLLENPDRDIRRAAFESMYETYGKFKNTLAASYKANVAQAVFYARARKYGSSLEAALSGSCIPVKVYDNLIETVREALPLLHRYVRLRKRMLGLEELHMYDLYVPMISGVEMKIPYEEAKNIVLDGLSPMGEEYLTHLKAGMEGGWIDVYENQGKRSGAYSWGAYGTHPYVLLNYQDNLNNVFTLAHEMGHALHSYYSDSSQPYVYAGYKIFVAEVASTCNESLLIHSLMEKADDPREKAYLTNYFLEQFRGTVFRQTMFAEFEKKTHAMAERGETLTADVLCSLYYELNKEYFGDDITADREIAVEWARIPHFYTPFYVYQYATGFSAAIALSGKILREGGKAVEDYKKFLRGGSSAYPLELLRMAGVDMESPQPIREAMGVFEDYLKQLELLSAVKQTDG